MTATFTVDIFDTINHMLCNDCGATFSYATHIQNTGYVNHVLIGDNRVFEGLCPNCDSPRVFADPAVENEEE